MHSSLERLRQRRQSGEYEGGFTLIELLIVIVILGILAAIVVFAVQNLSGSSAQAACSSDYKTVESAAEVYKAQVGHYPNVGDPAAATSGGTAVTNTAASPATGIQVLFGSQTIGSTTVGPWLKDTPTNTGHYSIVLSDDSKGTITVDNASGNGVASCSAVS